MVYHCYTPEGSEVSLHDLQDKGPWCEHGFSKEQVFIRQFGDRLSLVENPEKRSNKFAPDLFNNKTKTIGDLKTQNTPFFKANVRYKFDPQFTVTFNKKDVMRYTTDHPNIEIYFWVDWLVIKYVQDSQEIKVNPMAGVWFIKFSDLLDLVKTAPLHTYMQRKGDMLGNALSSYLLSLTDKRFTKVV